MNRKNNGLCEKWILLCLSLCILYGTNCIERQWENPLDPDYSGTWTKFYDSPKFGPLEANYFLFSINHRIFFLIEGTSRKLYEFSNNQIGLMNIALNFTGNRGFDATVFRDKIFILSSDMSEISFSLVSFDPVKILFVLINK